jgi:hypothetical protein
MQMQIEKTWSVMAWHPRHPYVHLDTYRWVRWRELLARTGVAVPGGHPSTCGCKLARYRSSTGSRQNHGVSIADGAEDHVRIGIALCPPAVRTGVR